MKVWRLYNRGNNIRKRAGQKRNRKEQTFSIRPASRNTIRNTQTKNL